MPMTTTAIARISELDRYIAEVSRYPIFLGKMNSNWQGMARPRRHKAAHALVTANLRFVVKIANEYRGYGAKILDLVQEGSIGLMQAVKRMIRIGGIDCLSYAVFWIRSYIPQILDEHRANDQDRDLPGPSKALLQAQGPEGEVGVRRDR